MLLDRDAIARVVELLRAEDFYRDAHRRIFDAITDLFERGEPVDLITVTDRLRDKSQLDDVGGASYVTSLLNTVPTAANVEYYARIVRKKSVLRHTWQEFTAAAHRILTEPDGIRTIGATLRTVEALMEKAAQGNDVTGLVAAANLADEPIAYVIDTLLPRRMLTLMSGRDKRGKTLLAEEMARCVVRGEPLFGRFSTTRGPVMGLFLDDPEGLTRGRLDALGILNHPHLFVSTSKRADLSDPVAFLQGVEQKAREVEAVLVVLDALYLFVPTGRDAANDQARMGPLMGQLNALAESTGAAVLVVAHDSKSGHDVAGSHVIRAAAKTILRLVLPHGSEEDPDEGPTTPRRVLKVESKLAPPASWALELRGVGQWLFLGTQRMAREASIQALVRDHLTHGGEGTAEEISIAINRRLADVQQALVELVTAGVAVRDLSKAGGRGRPRQVFKAAQNFLPETPEGKSDANPRVYQGVPASEEFPSGQTSPREGQWEGNSAPEDRRRTREDTDFSRLIGQTKDLFGGEVVYDGPPKNGPWGMPLEDGRRIAFMRMGHAPAWVAVPEVGVGEGMQVWRGFALDHSEQEIGQALLALERLEASGGLGSV